MNKWDYTKLQNMCTQKETKWKGNLGNGRNYLQVVYLIMGYIQDIWQTPTIQQLKSNNLNFKWAKEFRHPQRRYTMCMKRCSLSLIITEMKIKTKTRYRLTSIRMTTGKISQNIKCWGCAEIEMLVHYGWDCKTVQQSLLSILFNIYLFIWLLQVLVAALRTLRIFTEVQTL